MPDKLTDKEVVKALELCGDENASCEKCPFLKDDFCRFPLAHNTLDLINRLQEKDKTRHKVFETKCEEFEIAKAENERLKIENAKLRGYKTNDWLIRGISPEQLEHEKIQAWKAEAYKEFAKRSKEKAYTYSDITGYQSTVVDVNEIDGVYEELVGENNGKEKE